MNTLHRKALGGVVACVLWSVSGLADGGQPPVVVSYGDLDLSTHDGVATMYARLEAAAKSACTGNESDSPCVDHAVRQAVARIGAPRLVVLYETRTGHFLPRARGKASLL